MVFKHPYPTLGTEVVEGSSQVKNQSSFLNWSHPPSDSNSCVTVSFNLSGLYWRVFLCLQGEWKDKAVNLAANTEGCGEGGWDGADQSRDRWESELRWPLRSGESLNHPPLCFLRGWEGGAGGRDQVWTESHGEGNRKKNFWNRRCVCLLYLLYPVSTLWIGRLGEFWDSKSSYFDV